MEHEAPTLIEPGIKNFAVKTLKQCHEIKLQYYNTVFNISIACVFLFVVALVLVFKYRGKMSPEEKKKNEQKKKEYILSRIQNFQESKEKMHQTLITGLPGWSL